MGTASTTFIFIHGYFTFKAILTFSTFLYTMDTVSYCMIIISICLFVIIHVFPFTDIVFETMLFPLFIDLCFPKSTIIFSSILD